MPRPAYLFALTLAAIISYTYSTPPIEIVATYKKPQELTCTHELQPLTSVSWYFNQSETALDVPADSKKYEVFSENATLRIKSIDPTVVATYECAGTAVDNTTHRIAFDLQVQPYVVQPDKPRNVIQGDPLSLECKAWAVPPPTIVWQHNGTTLTDKAFEGRVQLKPNSGTSDTNSIKFPVLQNGTLRIENIEDKEGGEYTCFVMSTTGEANATTTVHIKDKYAALWPFLGICVEVAVLCTIIMIYEKRRAKRIEEEERQEEAAHLNANNDNNRTAALPDDVRQRK